MLHQYQAQQYAHQHHTLVENVIKEYYQIEILNLLFNSKLGHNIIFKGGTALRLAHGSFRFSEDLDFALKENLGFSLFQKAVIDLTKKIKAINIKDVHKKRFTYFAKISISLDYLTQPIGIKIEINKKEQAYPSRLHLLKSPFNPVEVLGETYTLTSLYQDKLSLQTKRRKPRDLFDLWYIASKLDLPLEIKPEWRYSKKQLQDDLNVFLPQEKRQVLKLFEA